ncbi:MAG: sodium:solute symporter [Candidatus Hydrogenedentes bacterium]|nr:sodium:solute symporter [Candidatus Hydrogenedentota bacterium]
MTFGTLDWVILIVYFLAMAMMGPLFARKNKSTESYFLGNRSFPGWLIGLSMFATSISSITFVAYPADAYKTAYLRFLLALMLPVGIFIASILFLPFFRHARVTSAFEYLEGRFGPGVRVYAATTFIINQVVRLSLILYLVSLLVHEMTGWDRYTCVFIGGVFTAFYTVTGGIEAVIWTDFIQSFLLWGGGLVCLYVAVSSVDGGIPTVVSTAWADGKFMLGDLNKEGQLVRAPLFSLAEKSVIMMFLIGLANWLTEYSSNQNVIQKYVATKNPKEAKRAIWICCLCSLPTWAFFMFLGTTLYVYYKLNPDPIAHEILTGANGRKADSILPFFIIKALPQGFSGLVIAGVLAAAMSSLSSSINAISAVGITDIYKRHIVRQGTDRHYVVAAWGVSILSSILMIGGAALLMWANSKTLQDTSTKLNSLLMCGLLGLYFFGFVTVRGDVRAVIVSLVCTIAFSAWMMFIEMGLITKSLLMGVLHLPEGFAGWAARPMDSYYAGLAGNIIMFAVAYVLSIFVFTAKRNLNNLTFWTQDWTEDETK